MEYNCNINKNNIDINNSTNINKSNVSNESYTKLTNNNKRNVNDNSNDIIFSIISSHKNSINNINNQLLSKVSKNELIAALKIKTSSSEFSKIVNEFNNCLDTKLDINAFNMIIKDKPTYVDLKNVKKDIIISLNNIFENNNNTFDKLDRNINQLIDHKLDECFTNFDKNKSAYDKINSIIETKFNNLFESKINENINNYCDKIISNIMNNKQLDLNNIDQNKTISNLNVINILNKNLENMTNNKLNIDDANNLLNSKISKDEFVFFINDLYTKLNGKKFLEINSENCLSVIDNKDDSINIIGDFVTNINNTIKNLDVKYSKLKDLEIKDSKIQCSLSKINNDIEIINKRTKYFEDENIKFQQYIKENNNEISFIKNNSIIKTKNDKHIKYYELIDNLDKVKALDKDIDKLFENVKAEFLDIGNKIENIVNNLDIREKLNQELNIKVIDNEICIKELTNNKATLTNLIEKINNEYKTVNDTLKTLNTGYTEINNIKETSLINKNELLKLSEKINNDNNLVYENINYIKQDLKSEINCDVLKIIDNSKITYEHVLFDKIEKLYKNLNKDIDEKLCKEKNTYSNDLNMFKENINTILNDFKDENNIEKLLISNKDLTTKLYKEFYEKQKDANLKELKNINSNLFNELVNNVDKNDDTLSNLTAEVSDISTALNQKIINIDKRIETFTNYIDNYINNQFINLNELVNNNILDNHIVTIKKDIENLNNLFSDKADISQVNKALNCIYDELDYKENKNNIENIIKTVKDKCSGLLKTSPIIKLSVDNLDNNVKNNKIVNWNNCILNSNIECYNLEWKDIKEKYCNYIVINSKGLYKIFTCFTINKIEDNEYIKEDECLKFNNIFNSKPSIQILINNEPVVNSIDYQDFSLFNMKSHIINENSLKNINMFSNIIRIDDYFYLKENSKISVSFNGYAINGILSIDKIV